MRGKTNYFLIGLFVLVGAGLIVFAVVAFGAGSLLQSKMMTETYLTESVQGLEKGSPVRFRGLRIGEVEEITLVSKYYDTDKPWVLLRMSLLKEVFPKPDDQTIRERIHDLVQQGLRVRLAAQGLTGGAYIESDLYEPAKYPPLDFDWTPKALYVPSAPSLTTRVVSSLETVLEKVKNTKFDALVDHAGSLLASAQQQLEGADVPALSREARTLLQSGRELLDDTRRDLSAALRRAERVTGEAEQLLADVRRAFDDGDLAGTIQRVHALLGEAQTLVPDVRKVLQRSDGVLLALERAVQGRAGDLQATLTNLRWLTQQLGDLSRTLERYPSLLLFGEKPPPVEIR